MEYVEVGGTNLRACRVCLGTWAIGGRMWGGTEERESISAILSALDRGINSFVVSIYKYKIRRLLAVS